MAKPRLIQLMKDIAKADGCRENTLDQHDIDANAVLECLLLEIEPARVAEIVRDHGFTGDYSVINRLRKAAEIRRETRTAITG